jgi:hypothetical protein
MSERMWISEQLDQARTERDSARLLLAAKDAEIAALREALIEARLRLKQAYVPSLPVFSQIDAALEISGEVK